MNKLHIGCGRCYMPGWINADIFSNVHADVYADMSALPYPRETFDLIYASHVLEHCNRHMVAATLTHWRDLLKTGGILRIAVPDFKACAEWYNKTGYLEQITGLLWGGQNHPRNNHFIGFDHETLSKRLIHAGFAQSSISTWNWKDTDHSHFDDYSQAYLPHMDKETGMLMSLNLQAIK